jgi:hypothetical protein
LLACICGFLSFERSLFFFFFWPFFSCFGDNSQEKGNADPVGSWRYVCMGGCDEERRDSGSDGLTMIADACRSRFNQQQQQQLVCFSF